jgi:hypothetical protein
MLGQKLGKELKTMKAYITKHALTKGIYTVEIETDNVSSFDMDEILCFKGNYFIGKGVEWHLTKEAAINKAEEMRLKKIASLKKQLAKMEALSFRK